MEGDLRGEMPRSSSLPTKSNSDGGSPGSSMESFSGESKTEDKSGFRLSRSGELNQEPHTPSQTIPNEKRRMSQNKLQRSTSVADLPSSMTAMVLESFQNSRAGIFLSILFLEYDIDSFLQRRVPKRHLYLYHITLLT
jgi:hypothetical protein